MLCFARHVCGGGGGGVLLATIIAVSKVASASPCQFISAYGVADFLPRYSTSEIDHIRPNRTPDFCDNPREKNIIVIQQRYIRLSSTPTINIDPVSSSSPPIRQSHIRVNVIICCRLA
jgi:hypothetical protein